MLIRQPDGTNFWDATEYPAFPSGAGRRLYYDTEGNGLYETQGSKQAGDRMWCMGFIDLDTREEFYFGVDQLPGTGRCLEDGLRFLGEADFAIAHNGYGFDRRALRKWCPAYKPPKKEWDSLVLVKVIWPAETLLGPDLKRIKAGLMPGHLLKSHSLKAWGYRTGTHKGEYTLGFDAWCPEMAAYMMQDNAGGIAIWDLCMKRLGWTEEAKAKGEFVWPELPIEIEHETLQIILEQQEDGACLNLAKANKLTADLQNHKARIERQLCDIFGSWWQRGEVETPARSMQRAMVGFPDITVKRFGKTGKELKPYVGPPLEHFTEGGSFQRIEWTTFNPSSRQHLAMRLQDVYGWKPKAFGKDGTPTVDETVLGEIPESVMPPDIRQAILDYFVVAKTLGMLTQGRQAWTRLVGEDGKVHGRVDPLGAVTGRGTHSGPNMSQTPAVRKAKEKLLDGTSREVMLMGLAGRFGYEGRDLFEPDPGCEQTGIDKASLELILLGHYLFPMDDGAFSARVCDPTRDSHAENAEITGTSRADAKTAIYLKVYGGSAYKLSLDPAIIVLPEDVPELLSYRGLPGLLRALEKRMGEDYREPDDMGKARLVKARKIIVAFDQNIAGLADLMEGVTEAAKARGYLRGLDGRKVHVRKPHAALNSLLQSAGAQACKLWMVLLRKAMLAEGWVRGRDFRQMLWVHDELQFSHRPGLGPRIRELAEECSVEAGVMLGLRGRFRTDGKTGKSWAECH